VDASGNVAFRIEKRHFYFSSLAISLFSLLVDKELRHPVAILPNRRQKLS
jgi:hypothetical protein